MLDSWFRTIQLQFKLFDATRLRAGSLLMGDAPRGLLKEPTETYEEALLLPTAYPAQEATTARKAKKRLCFVKAV